MKRLSYLLIILLFAGFCNLHAQESGPSNGADWLVWGDEGQQAAQKPEKGKLLTNAHSEAHRKQLANVRSRMDKGVLMDVVRKDISNRESLETAVPELSAETSILLKDLLTEARSHLGKRYRSGAKGPSAFDCSGFSSYVFRQFGYDLNSSSSAQYAQGVSVGRSQLREGDLVFFTGRNSKSKRVGHVGIVVTADNDKGTFTFIHASTSGGIKIDNIGGYYAHRYIGARRIVTEE